MAASFADDNSDQIDGIVFFASYPANSDDLSDQDIDALSIYGTQDGLASPSKIQASKLLLPQDTRWLPIEGGNHAQFGWYGSQSGDNEATISRVAQQEQIVQATLELLSSLNGEQ
jgi:pimeloyl-ACP methyl ester carboxylesterase